MSSSDRKLFRLAAAAGVAALLGASLGGCGFQPLYGSGANDQAVSDELASVRIEPLKDRVGQLMHNFLRDRVNPSGQPASPNYLLRLELKESVSKVGVRRDETATRANLKMSVEYQLMSVDGATELLDGRSSSTTSYDILDNPFATTVSEDAARERALRQMASDIETRLALYFAKQ